MNDDFTLQRNRLCPSFCNGIQWKSIHPWFDARRSPGYCAPIDSADFLPLPRNRDGNSTFHPFFSRLATRTLIMGCSHGKCDCIAFS